MAYKKKRTQQNTGKSRPKKTTIRRPRHRLSRPSHRSGSPTGRKFPRTREQLEHRPGTGTRTRRDHQSGSTLKKSPEKAKRSPRNVAKQLRQRHRRNNRLAFRRSANRPTHASIVLPKGRTRLERKSPIRVTHRARHPWDTNSFRNESMRRSYCLFGIVPLHEAQSPPVQAPSLHGAFCSLRRASSTAQWMPRSCICLLVAISESMNRPFTQMVMDIPATKNATKSSAKRKTYSVVDMAKFFKAVLGTKPMQSYNFACKFLPPNAT